MVGLILGADDTQLRERLAARSRGRSVETLREAGILVGTPDAVAGQVNEYAERGAERIMLQWLYLDDVDGLEALARSVLE